MNATMLILRFGIVRRRGAVAQRVTYRPAMSSAASPGGAGVALQDVSRTPPMKV